MNIIEKLNKALGKKVASYGDKKERVETLPTGLTSLDMVIGGGLPKGRITVFKGLESVAKTSLALHFIAQCQKDGIKCAFVDAEYAFNPLHAMSIGVDTEELLMIKPDSGEEAFEAIETIIRENAAKVIVVDSVSALIPRPEAEAEYGVKTMGGQARLISQGMRKIISPLHKSGAVLIFINQLRMNIMGGQWDPFTESGGLALKYYTSVALRLSKNGSLMDGDTALGIGVKIKVTKNKIGPPFGECLLKYVFKEGWSDGETTLGLAVNAGVVEQKGNTYFFNNEKIGVGKEKAEDSLNANPQLKAEILSQISLQSSSKP